MPYPKVTCDLNILLNNVNTLADFMHARGKHFAAVTKCFAAAEPIVSMLEQSRCDSLADARIKNLASMKTEKPRLLIRIAQPWEIPEAVEYADMSFQSERTTLEKLNDECLRRGKRHGVLLALDMGDLREGCYFKDEQDIMQTAEAVLRCRGLELLGVGTNLGCFGGVRTTAENMRMLCDIAEDIQSRFSVELPYISGMSTAAQKMLFDGRMPRQVNHGRFGELWLVGHDSVEGCYVPRMRSDAFTLSAQLVEIKTKDSKPVGLIGGDAFGHVIEREDTGPMRRGIIACGAQDIDRDTLFPTDGQVKIIGGSSDHTLLDLSAAPRLQVGDVLQFQMQYGSVMRAYTSCYVEKEYVELQ